MALITYVHIHNRAAVSLGKGVRITFNGGTYATGDAAEQQLIESHGLFGKDFKRLETARDYERLRGHRERSTVYAVGPQTTIQKNPVVKVEETVEEIAPSEPRPVTIASAPPKEEEVKRGPGRPRRIV